MLEDVDTLNLNEKYAVLFLVQRYEYISPYEINCYVFLVKNNRIYIFFFKTKYANSTVNVKEHLAFDW